MSEYLKSLEPNDAQYYIKKLTLTIGECLPDPYTLLLKSGKKISISFQILPGAMLQNILSKRQVCTQRNQ